MCSVLAGGALGYGISQSNQKQPVTNETVTNNYYGGKEQETETSPKKNKDALKPTSKTGTTY